MIYLYIVMALLVIGGGAYLIYRRRSVPPSPGAAAEPSEPAPESKPAETPPEKEPANVVPEPPAAPAARGAARMAPQRPLASTTREASRRTPQRSVTPATRGTPRRTPEPPAAQTTEKTTYPIAELSILPEDAKLKLMNAVWYRCENPYCNHTEFLDVHHIVDDGSNDLNNLIVLCPRCHTAAHDNEITAEELHSWLAERADRFKTELDWPYK